MKVYPIIFTLFAILLGLASCAVPGSEDPDNSSKTTPEGSTNRNSASAEAQKFVQDTSAAVKDQASKFLDYFKENADAIRKNPDAYVEELKKLKEHYNESPESILEDAGIKTMMNPSFINMPIGIVMIVAGLFIAFLGRRVFKAFLAISGAIVGSSVFLFGLVLIETKSGIDAPTWLFWVFGLMGAFTGSAVFVKAWKWAVYALSAYGGVMLGIWILGVIHGFEFAQYIDRNIFLAVCAILGLFLAHFVDEFVVIFSSALMGAFTTVFGYDLIVGVGFRVFIKNIIDNTPSNLVDHILEQTSVLSNVRYCMLAVLGIASAGIYSQYRYQPRSYDRD